MLPAAFIFLALASSLSASPAIPSPPQPPPAAPSTPASATRPAEVTSILGDLWRDRDYIFLRVDGRLPANPGFAPAGATDLAIKITSLARGREWPGRWTMLELELRPVTDEDVTLAFDAVEGAPPTVPIRIHLPKGTWTTPRLLLPQKLTDLRVTVPAGLKDKLEFRHVRLVDDRATLWSDKWDIRRAAGQLTFTFPPTSATPSFTLPGNCELLEANAIRAVVRQGRDIATVYRTGRACTGDPATPHLTLTASTDDVRLDRTTDGDPDGTGYNARLGATILRTPSKHFRLTVAPDANVTTVPQPALELRDLPPGPITALWDGKPLTTLARLPDNTALLQLPADVRAPTTLEVTVGN